MSNLKLVEKKFEVSKEGNLQDATHEIIKVAVDERIDVILDSSDSVYKISYADIWRVVRMVEDKSECCK